VQGDTYSVRLNEHRASFFINLDAGRGLGVDRDPSSGFIGLQEHTGSVSFRAVRILKAGAAPAPAP
jgi:hypothetical protein